MLQHDEKTLSTFTSLICEFFKFIPLLQILSFCKSCEWKKYLKYQFRKQVRYFKERETFELTLLFQKSRKYDEIQVLGLSVTVVKYETGCHVNLRNRLPLSNQWMIRCIQNGAHSRRVLQRGNFYFPKPGPVAYFRLDITNNLTFL